MRQICLAITAIALAVSAAAWLAGCAQQKNLWATICSNQAEYVKNIPAPFMDPSQAALALATLCGTVAPSPIPTPAPTPVAPHA